MYTRKIYEPESKFSLQIARNPGASVRSGAKGTGKSIERSSAKWTIDTSGEERIQQRRKNGSGQLSQISPYKAKESVLDEDIQNLFRVDTGILEHHVKNYVSDYSRWYSESMQEIGNMGWSERYSSSDSLDKGAAVQSRRSQCVCPVYGCHGEDPGAGREAGLPGEGAGGQRGPGGLRGGGAPSPGPGRPGDQGRADPGVRP